MKNFTKTILTSASAALISGVALADGHMSMEMTIVSWGGAYSNSQLKAYHEPYSANTGVTILNDDSSSTAVAQLRAMNEAKNDDASFKPLKWYPEGDQYEYDASECVVMHLVSRSNAASKIQRFWKK